MIIYWHSNAPWVGTGYGNQTAIFPKRLKNTLGHGITVSSFYGLSGAPRCTDDMWVFPNGRDPYGNDVIAEDAAFLNADIVITLMDIWVLQQQVMSEVRWVPWMPVDHDPAPPAVVEALKPAYQPIAYSKFGVQKLQEAGYQPLYVPHGVETDVFKPADRAEMRAKHSGCLNDVFLVGIVAANKGRPSRKAFDQQIRAFAELHKRHGDTMLYIHTEFEGENMGENIARIVELAGVEPKAIAKPNQYRYRRGMINTEQMVSLYNSFDVLMNATRGEGFGIPILEAQACGTPVIVTDFSSMPELCFSGWKVGYSDKEFTYQGSYQVLPSVPDLVDALEEAYQQNSEQRQAMRDKARAGALTYDADLVTTEYWKPALDAIEARIAEEKSLAAASHRWAGVGQFIKGEFYIPCLDHGCTAGMMQNGNIKGGMFTGTIGDMTLDIEDDPKGGVSKIIMREAVDQYHVLDIDMQPGDMVLDIGAHVGIISCYLAKRFPGVRVIAVEPAAANYKRLLRNIEANGLTGRIETLNAAVTGDGRRVAFPISSNGNSGGLSIYHGGPETVQSYTLQELYDKFGISRPTILKIDCEGAEYEILEGKTDLLMGVKYLMGEVHVNNKFSRERALGLIETCKRAVGNGHVWLSHGVMLDVEFEPLEANDAVS